MNTGINYPALGVLIGLTAAVFGSLANIAQQLREALRYCVWPAECFDSAAARARRVVLDSS